MCNYDVAIIGSGVTGAATAAVLSRYRLRTVVLEKEADVGFGVSKANSGIVHGGFHYPAETTLKGKLEVAGARRFPELARQLGFPFKACGIVLAAFSLAELNTVKTLYLRGRANGVDSLELCGADRIYELEPTLAPGVVGGLFAPEGGVVEPYRYVFALIELAQLNGVEVKTGFEVSYACQTGEGPAAGWEIASASGETVGARYAINAAGLCADAVSALFGAEEFTICPCKGEEYLLDRSSTARPRHVVFPVPAAHSKGVLVIPTAGGTTMVGPTAEMVADKTDTTTTFANREAIFKLARQLVPGVSERDLIASFSGSRPTLESGDFFIAPSQKVPHLIQAAGIQSPGLTASPAVGEYIRDLLAESGLAMADNPAAVSQLPPHFAVRELDPEAVDALHASDPAWTNIVCSCEKISEAEVIDAIRHGHTTLDGVKFYTRSGMGRCQGGVCGGKIIAIIARETGLPPDKITKRGNFSCLLGGKTEK